MKACIKCGILYPKTNEYFYIDNKLKSGLSNLCIPCMKEKNKMFYLKFKEKRKKEVRDYYYKNIVIIKEKNNKKNREKYAKNKDKINERRRFLWSNRDTNRKIKWNETRNSFRNNKYKNDLNFRLENKLRTRMYIILKLYNGKKHSKFITILGCDIEYFKIWLESQFDNNMTWNNYGSYWHIDHILPCSAFELQNSEEQEICFHYTNLRPLEGKENIRKGNKII